MTKKREKYVSPAARNAAAKHERDTGHATTELYDDDGNMDGMCCFHCDWMRYNVQPRKTIGQRDAIAAMHAALAAPAAPAAAPAAGGAAGAGGGNAASCLDAVAQKLGLSIFDYNTSEILMAIQGLQEDAAALATPAPAVTGAAGDAGLMALHNAGLATPGLVRGWDIRLKGWEQALETVENLLDLNGPQAKQAYGKFLKAYAPGWLQFARELHGRLHEVVEYAAATPPAPGPGAAVGTGEAVGVWVSVSERLPQDNIYTPDKPTVQVLVSRPDAGYTDSIAVGYLYDNEWFIVIADGDDSIQDNTVTHWQPLPAAPTTGAAPAAAETGGAA